MKKQKKIAPKAKRKFSPAQLAAQKRFAEMVRHIHAEDAAKKKMKKNPVSKLKAPGTVGLFVGQTLFATAPQKTAKLIAQAIADKIGKPVSGRHLGK